MVNTQHYTTILPDHAVWGHGEYTVFLLHGGYGCKDYWLPEVAHLLEHGFRVVAWDTPGYGLSPLPEVPYTIELMADNFNLLVDTVGSPGKKNILLGHSMGGLIGPRAAADRPDRIAAQIISSTVESLGHTDPDYQAAFIAERLGPLEAGLTLKAAVPELMKKMMGPDSSGEAVDLVLKITAETKDETFKAALQAIVAYDGRSALRATTVPTLCIAGELDPVGKPEMMKSLANTVTGEFVCIPEVAHYCWAEKPQLFNDAVMKFLAGVIQ